MGRPAGPDRVPMSVRILNETDIRLDTAIAMTGQTLQDFVEAAVVAYMDALGVPPPEA